MVTQSEKYAVGMAGEFYVAAELLRRGYLAAVTHGNAKKADVVALKGEKAVAIEVKSTSAQKWVVGNKMPTEGAKPWVLVYFPSGYSPPEFFICSSSELRKALMPEDARYREAYREKHSKDFEGVGVYSVKRELMQSFKNNWGVIASAMAD